MPRLRTWHASRCLPRHRCRKHYYPTSIHPSSFHDEWGHPASAYKFGSKLKGVIETARAQVGELSGAQLREEALSPESGSGLSVLHSEPGLCRREFMDDFTTVQLSNGMIVSLGMAKKMGLMPPDAMPG